MIEQPTPPGREREALKKAGEVVIRLRTFGHLMDQNQGLWDRLIEKAESRMDGFIFTQEIPILSIPENGNLRATKLSGMEYKFVSPTSPDKKYIYFALDERFVSFRLGTFDIREVEEGDKFSFSYIDLFTQEGKPKIHLAQENFVYGVKSTGEFIRIYISKDPIAIFDKSDTKKQEKKSIPVEEALSHYFEPDIREFSSLAKLLNQKIFFSRHLL